MLHSLYRCMIKLLSPELTADGLYMLLDEFNHWFFFAL